MRFKLAAGTGLLVVCLGSWAGAEPAGLDVIVTRQNGQDLMTKACAACHRAYRAKTD